MYTTYTTDAFVFSREGVGEADVRLELFTKDFGIIRARAAGARAESSKLRYALQTYARSNVALVRGANGWRLTGADLSYAPTSDPRATARCARVVMLVRTLLAAEEPNADICHLLVTHMPVESDDAELALVASVLSLLGYMPATRQSEEVYAHWLAIAHTDRNALLSTVNNALSANHISQK